MPKRGTYEDLTGQRFGKLVAIRRTSNWDERGGTHWLFMCDCGEETEKLAGAVKYGKTQSCGCKNFESKNKRHGDVSGDVWAKEYNSWAGMIQRCNNPSSHKYSIYGARGILVCDRWRLYENFLEDMGRKPSDRHSLDRIDTNGNYEPANCRWSLPEAQQNNRRTNYVVEHDGQSLTLAQWARKVGMSGNALRNRIVVLGWDVARAITTPIMGSCRKKS